MKATEILKEIYPLVGSEREKIIFQHLEQDHVPNFLLTNQPFKNSVTAILNKNILEYFVFPEYLSLGEDDDYFLCPMNPETCRSFMAKHGLLLPTCKMVKQIYKASSLKVLPSPISPNSQRTNLFVIINQKIMLAKQSGEPEVFIAGHKKDVVLSNVLAGKSYKDRVGLYGWFKKDGTVIQDLYCKHYRSYVDYSHGLRMVYDKALLNGVEVSLKGDILRHPELCLLLHDEKLEFLSY